MWYIVCTGSSSVMIAVLLLIMPGFVAVSTVCPVRCTCTVKDSVACEDKTISDIATFNIPHNFTYVRVSGTKATELTEFSFQQMPFTVRLFLQSNRFSIIRPGTFQKFPLLKTLRLSKNNVSSLPSEVFSTLIYLEHLYLDENVLVYLDPSIFNNLSSLNILNLSINRLQALPKNIFRSLSKLTHLILNGNQLVEIPNWMFDNLMELVELHLHSNLIEMIDKEAFYQLPKLKKLSLQKNCLKTLADGLFLYLHKLESLSLYENPLKELPNVLFGKIDTLRSFRLWGTSLSTIPNFIFRNLTNLEVLVLTKNVQLHSLPKDTFSGLTKLVELYLHTNNFSSLPVGLFQDLQSLQNLSLYNNSFDDIPDNLLRPLIKVQNVYLNNSKITTLPGNVFKLLPKLQSVYLAGNPWMCDCKLVEFKSWLENNTEKVPNHMSLLCTNPPKLKATPVLALEVLVCPSTSIREQKRDSYMLTKRLSSWVNFNISDRMTIATTTTEYITGVLDYSGTLYTSNWDNRKKPYMNHTKTTGRTSGHELQCKLVMLRRCSLPSGNIIYYLLYFTTSAQLFLTTVQCFVLIKIRIFYNHFNIPTEPIVLVNILVPPNCPSPDSN